MFNSFAGRTLTTAMAILLLSLSEASANMGALWKAVAAIAEVASVTELAQKIKGYVDQYPGAMIQQEAFKQSLSTLGSQEAALSKLLVDRGEQGMLLDVYIFERTGSDGQPEYAFGGILPTGMGSTEEDAALNAYLVETKIEEQPPSLAIAAKNLPTDFSGSRAFDKYSFSIWSRRSDTGKLVI